jgi:hypothetical protein
MAISYRSTGLAMLFWALNLQPEIPSAVSRDASSVRGPRMADSTVEVLEDAARSKAYEAYECVRNRTAPWRDRSPTGGTTDTMLMIC